MYGKIVGFVHSAYIAGCVLPSMRPNDRPCMCSFEMHKINSQAKSERKNINEIKIEIQSLYFYTYMCVDAYETL